MNIAPFIKITTTTGEIFNEKEVVGFTYKYSEEDDDVAEITIQSGDVMLCDRPGVQEGEALTCTWGYLDGGPVQTRKVYIFDTKAEYSEEGVVLNLTCHEKFVMTKMNVAAPKNPSTSKEKDPNKIIIQSDVLNNIFINNKSTSNLGFFDKATNLNPRDKALIERSINDPAFKNDGTTLRPTQETMYDYEDPQIDARNIRVTRNTDSLNVTFYNGNAPTYRSLREYLDKAPGGPYVIDSRDDEVTIRTRDMGQRPLFDYAYGGEPGTLLTFSPETKNRSKASTSENVKTISWDTENQKATVSTSENKSEGQTQQYLWEKLQQANSSVGTPEWFKNLQNQPLRPRLVGDAAAAVGIKEWPQVTEYMGDKGDERYKPYTLNDGNILYTDNKEMGKGTTGQNLGSGTLAPRDNTSTILPHYIRKTPVKNAPGKSIVLGAETAPQAKAYAENTRTNSQLENNPATATMVGNPLLKSGIIITISNVARRHAGKYYIKDCTHTLDDNGYITSIDVMVRPGIKTSSTKVDVRPPETDRQKIESKVDQFNQYHKSWEQVVKESNPVTVPGEFDQPWVKQKFSESTIEAAKANAQVQVLNPDES